MVQYADHWNCWLASGDSHPEAYQAPLDAMMAACEKHGRDPATLERSVTPRICPASYLPDFEAMKPLHGSTNEIADRIRGFEAMGVQHLPVWLLRNNNEGIEAFAPVLEELRSG